MTNLVNITLIFTHLLCVPFTIFSQNLTKEIDGHYCNQKYNFCIEYPTETFPFEAVFNQSNGLVLRSEDGTSEVIIAGYKQDAPINSESAFLASIEQINAAHEKPKIMSSLFGEDFYECFFILGHNFSYHKSFSFEGHVVRLEIRVPISNPVLLKTLRDSISLDVKVGGERVGYRSEF